MRAARHAVQTPSVDCKISDKSFLMWVVRREDMVKELDLVRADMLDVIRRLEPGISPQAEDVGNPSVRGIPPPLPASDREEGPSAW